MVMGDIHQLECSTENDGRKPVLAWIKNDPTTAQMRIRSAS